MGMNEKELDSMRGIIISYGYPSRGKILTLIAEYATLQNENERLTREVEELTEACRQWREYVENQTSQ